MAPYCRTCYYSVLVTTTTALTLVVPIYRFSPLPVPALLSLFLPALDTLPACFPFPSLHCLACLTLPLLLLCFSCPILALLCSELVTIYCHSPFYLNCSYAEFLEPTLFRSNLPPLIPKTIHCLSTCSRLLTSVLLLSEL